MARDRFGEELESDGDVGSSQREKRSSVTTRQRPPRWETVPAGTPPAICRGKKCQAEIFFIRRPKYKNGQPVPGQTVTVPVDCGVPGGVRPTSIDEGKGVSHYGTCSDADLFNRARRMHRRKR